MDSIASNKKAVKVLAVGAILQLFLGVIYVWSIFVAPVSELLSWEASAVKLTSSYMLCFFVLGIVGGGRLLSKLNSRLIVLVGGVLLVSGILATTFIPQNLPWLLYITYGICGGFGIGMAYNTILTASQQWFPERRGFATGVCVSSFGFSAVIFAPIVEVLISKIGVVNVFYALAAVLAVAILCLFKFIKLPESSGENQEVVFSGKQFTLTEMLKTKQFYYITFALMFCTATYFVLNPSFKSLAIERGLSPMLGTSVVMIAGIGNAIGRLIVPIISEKFGREKTLIAVIAAMAICSLLLIFIKGVMFIGLVFIIAFCYGGPSGINPVIASDYFGLKYIGGNYGVVMLGFATSALLSPMLIGLIPNETVKYIILAVISAIGAVLIALLYSSKQSLLSETDQT